MKGEQLHTAPLSMYIDTAYTVYYEVYTMSNRATL